jgi:hypothetical protein
MTGVDLPVPVVDEHAKSLTHPEIDRGWLHERRLERVDLDRPRLDGLTD